jgi:gluconolactonase
LDTTDRADVSLLYSCGKGLFEAPRWSDKHGVVFSDAAAGGLHSVKEDGSYELLLGHRKGIGGIALHEDGGYVVTGRNVSYKLNDETATVTLIEPDPDDGRASFADLTVDSKGRVYVGSLGEVVSVDGDAKDPNRIPGRIYLIDTDGSSRVVDADFRLANGLGLSADGTVLYGNDSNRGVIFAWDVDSDTGELSGRRILFEHDEGILDGMAVSEDGHLWVAVAHAGSVLRISSEGELVGRIELPVEFVASVCFGGVRRSTLFVSTGNSGPEDPSEAAIYSMDVDVRGLDIPLAAISTITPAA